MNRRELALPEIIIGIVISLILVLLTRVGTFDLLYGIGGNLLGGLQQTSYTSFQGVAANLNFWGNLAQIRTENEQLHLEHDQLQAQNSQLQEQLKNNQLINKELEFDLPFRLLPARVIKYEDNLTGVFINKGSDQGVTVGMVAVIDNYAIGSVAQIFNNTAEIKLVNASDANLPVLVLENGAKGILNGDNTGDLIVSSILNDSKLAQGQTVVTSGLNSNYPYGLFIGKIDTFQSQSSQIDQTATLVSTVNLKDLSQVYLIQR